MEKQNKNPFYHDEDLMDIVVVNGEDVTLSYEGESSVRHVFVKFRGDSPLNWQDYANEYNTEDNWISLDKEKSNRMIAELVQAIEDGRVRNFLFSFEKWGEGHWLSGDFAGGWAALYYEDSDKNIHYIPYNASNDTVEKLAPVTNGGQSLVPKRFALEDMSLVSRIATHFLEAGQLCPGTQWVKEEESAKAVSTRYFSVFLTGLGDSRKKTLFFLKKHYKDSNFHQTQKRVEQLPLHLISSIESEILAVEEQLLKIGADYEKEEISYAMFLQRDRIKHKQLIP